MASFTLTAKVENIIHNIPDKQITIEVSFSRNDTLEEIERQSLTFSTVDSSVQRIADEVTTRGRAILASYTLAEAPQIQVGQTLLITE